MKFPAQRRFDKPLVPVVPVTIEVSAGPGRFLTLDWIAEIDSGSPVSLMAAEVTPDSSKFDRLPRFDGFGGFPLGDWKPDREFRALTCRVLFGGVPFTDWIVVVDPEPDGKPPRWPMLLGTDFLSTFTVTFEYHKTPPVFHVKNPQGKLDAVPDVDELVASIDGVGPQWRRGEGPWLGPDYTVEPAAPGTPGAEQIV